MVFMGFYRLVLDEDRAAFHHGSTCGSATQVQAEQASTR
jgi:hypothetical protein